MYRACLHYSSPQIWLAFRVYRSWVLFSCWSCCKRSSFLCRLRTPKWDVCVTISSKWSYTWDCLSQWFKCYWWRAGTTEKQSYSLIGGWPRALPCCPSRWQGLCSSGEARSLGIFYLSCQADRPNDFQWLQQCRKSQGSTRRARESNHWFRVQIQRSS